MVFCCSIIVIYFTICLPSNTEIIIFSARAPPADVSQFKDGTLQRSFQLPNTTNYGTTANKWKKELFRTKLVCLHFTVCAEKKLEFILRLCSQW